MPLRFPDQYPSLREVAGLSDTAFRLHFSAFFWCWTNRTDGVIPREDLGLVYAQLRAPERFAAECVRRGAWHDARDGCGSGDCPAPVEVDGWVLHDYLRDNPSREELEAEEAAVEAELAAKSAGGSKGNHLRWHANRGITDPECGYCAKPPAGTRKRAGQNPVQPKSSVDRSDKRSGTDRISDRSSESVPNPKKTLTLTQSPLLNPVSQSQDRNARAREDRTTDRITDDEATQQVIDRIYLVTGQFVEPSWARKVAAEILGKARKPVKDPLGYVLAAIDQEAETGNPHARFLPPSEPLFQTRPPWCENCDHPNTRMRERDDGRLEYCPECHPLRDQAVRSA